MKTAGEHHPTSRGKMISLAIIAVALVAGVYAARRSATHPSTDDATIDADVVHVASAVGGPHHQNPYHGEQQGLQRRPPLSDRSAALSTCSRAGRGLSRSGPGAARHTPAHTLNSEVERGNRQRAGATRSDQCNGVGSITDATVAESQLLQAKNASTDAYSASLSAAATLALAVGALGSAPR
jgi:hypothetical protein